jgi:ribosomal protein S18 acetylase RimI-like enzyme
MSDSRISRAWQTLRQEGLRSFWFKLFDVLGYRRLFLLSRSLAKPIPAVEPKIPLTINWLTAAEIDDYVAFRPKTSENQLAARFERNERCLAGRRADGKIVGVMWAATGRAWIEYLERVWLMEPGEVYLFNAYTDPAMRGHAIAPALSAELLRRFRDEGVEYAVRGTLPENKAALKAHAKAEFQIVGWVGRVSVGPWRHDFQDYHIKNL